MKNKYKLIYNPLSGKKRKLLSPTQPVSIDEVKTLLTRYQILADYFPTKGPKHATELARDSVKEGYENVLVAGGDGTVGEVANGLVHTDVTMGIIPLGTFMNIARMLAIPTDIEKAILLIKTGRTRKIDVGCVTRMSGEKLSDPYYFVEGAGVGLDATIHKHFLDAERGSIGSAFKMVKPLFEFWGRKGEIVIDGKEIATKATLLTISNGPFTGAALNLAPDAKLNDHRLSVRLFHMSKFELAKHVVTMWMTGNARSRKIKTYQAKKVVIKTETERLVHVDASLFGTTPVEFTIVPNALNVVYGFPENRKEAALHKRNNLVP